MLATFCMVSMMNTTRIEKIYFCLTIVSGVTGYSTYQSRTLKTYGCKVGANGFSIRSININPEIGQYFVDTSLGPSWKIRIGIVSSWAM